MKKDFSGLFLTLFVVLIFAAGILIAIHESKVSKENYNNGVCIECGGKYRFTSAEHIRNSSDRYYYTCEDCGHTIMTYSIQK